MNIKTIVLSAVTVLILLPGIGHAQIGIGGGFELRDGDPGSGYNLRVEKGFDLPIPFLKFRGRLQGGVYTDDTFKFNDAVVSFERNAEANSWYTGANLIAELKLPIFPFNPYGGFGVGYEKLNVTTEGVFSTGQVPPIPGSTINDGGTFFEVNAGLKLSFLPLIKPFFEYRYVEFFDDLDDFSKQVTSINTGLTENNRFVFGVMVQL